MVAEQLEEMGWTAGLLRTLGERLLRSTAAEVRTVGTTLVRHAEALLRLKEGHLARAQHVVEEAHQRRVRDEDWQFVGQALRACGEAIVTAARRYSEAARHLPTMEGDLRKAPGELLLFSRLMEERGGQMRRLGERLLALTEADRMALSVTLVTKSRAGVGQSLGPDAAGI